METPEHPIPPDDPARLARELHGERVRLEALLATVPGVVWEAWGAPDRANQRIDYVSAYVTEMLGYTVEEWLATPNFWLTIVHPDDRAEAARVGAETFMGGGAPRTNRFRWMRKDGRAIWVESRAVAILDGNGRPIGMRGVNYDIGAQIEAEAQARAEKLAAEEARRRHAWLSDVTAELARSLDLGTMLNNVARLLVPSFADWCVIHLLDATGRPRPLAIAHVDPAQVALGWELQERYPATADQSHGAWHVALTGVPQLHVDVAEDRLAAAARDERHLALLRAMGVRATLTVPMQMHGRSLGVLTLVSSKDGRRFGPEDLALAQEVARRCAVSVENARLYTDAQRVIAEREAAEARLRDTARRQAAMLEIGRVALREDVPEVLADKVGPHLAEMLRADAIVLVDACADGRARILGGHAHDLDRVDTLVDGLDEGTLAGAALAHGSIVVTDARAGRYRMPLSPRAWTPRSAAAVALTARGRPLGVLLAFAREEGRFGAHEIGFLESAGHLVASALGRVRATADLAAEKERLSVTLASIGDGVVATDTEARVVMLNPVAEALTGWTRAEAVGRHLSEVFPLVHLRTRVPCENPVDRVLATGAIVDLARHTALLARDGGERVITDSAAPIRDAEGRIHGVVLVFRDVTEQERLEEELRRASTLESVGVLAGGLAHDFNNLLTGILANLSLARVQASPGDRVHVRLGEAEKATLRARDLTQQLLTFAKGGAPVKKATSLVDVVRDSTAFVLSGSNVSPRFTVVSEPWVVEADAGQLSQVAQNLVLNAQQAMPEGGTLEIRLSNAELDGRASIPLAPGRYVRLDVVDTGVGIAPQHLPRVFDPFFTTKQKGSGLGLATAYAIVRKHDGHIAVRSQLGQGTAISVYLPAAPTAAVATPPTPLPAARGAGRVLVMDDDALIRDTAEALLGELGYVVTLASDGAEAIRVYRSALEAGQRFDAVLLDLTVPGGMGGRQAIEELRRIDPTIRAVVSSGYSEDPVMADFARHGFAAVMAKPYTIQEMSAVLGRVVGGPHATA